MTDSVTELISNVVGAEALRAPLHTTDLGNARRMEQLYGDQVKYCDLWKSWLVWDGKRWAIDQTRDIHRKAIEVTQHLYIEAGYQAEEAQRTAMARWAIKCESDNRRRAMVNTASSLLPTTPREWDRDPWLLNCENGTIDLDCGEIKPHNQHDRITKLINIKYNSEAVAPRWAQFLQEVTDGQHELIKFLQRAAGYSLTGDTREQCIFILYGKGANGKSTFLETLSALLGEYGTKTATDTLMVKRTNTIPNDIAALRGTRFVTAIEAEDGQRLAESRIKQMTGGDTMTARYLYGEYFQFRPTFKLWLATNHKPDIRGTDLAIWRRIRLVPFTVTIPEAKQDKSLQQQLRAELPGILTWAVQGCNEWRHLGLPAPTLVKSATDAYREEQDVLGQWLSDTCLNGPQLQAGATDLYNSYKQWAEQHGEYVETQSRFGRRLGERGYQKREMTRGITYIGLGLLSEQGIQQ